MRWVVAMLPGLFLPTLPFNGRPLADICLPPTCRACLFGGLAFPRAPLNAKFRAAAGQTSGGPSLCLGSQVCRVWLMFPRRREPHSDESAVELWELMGKLCQGLQKQTVAGVIQRLSRLFPAPHYNDGSEDAVRAAVQVFLCVRVNALGLINGPERASRLPGSSLCF